MAEDAEIRSETSSTIRSAKNLPSDMPENAEVGSGSSTTIRSAENLPLDMAKDAEVDDNGDGGDDKMVKRLPPSKMLSGSTGVSYLPTLRR